MNQSDKAIIFSVLVVLAISVFLLGNQVFLAPEGGYSFAATVDSTGETIESGVLNIGGSEEIICNPDITNPAICDYRFAPQDEYLDDDLYALIDHTGISNGNAWTISGGFLLAGVDQTEEEVIAATKEEIRDKFLSYLDRDDVPLNVDSTDFVQFDAEHPFSLLHLWQYDEMTTPKQSEIVEAFRVRLEVIREELPNVNLALWQIPRGGSNAGVDNDMAALRMEAYITAGELGLYDDLDSFGSPMFLAFPPGHANFGTTEAFVRDVIERGETLIELFGPDRIRIAPLQHIVYLSEDPETGEDVFILPEDQAIVNTVLQEYDSVEMINYWSQDDWYPDYEWYYTNTPIVPCECFNQ